MKASESSRGMSQPGRHVPSLSFAPGADQRRECGPVLIWRAPKFGFLVRTPVRTRADCRGLDPCDPRLPYILNDS